MMDWTAICNLEHKRILKQLVSSGAATGTRLRAAVGKYLGTPEMQELGLPVCLTLVFVLAILIGVRRTR